MLQEAEGIYIPVPMTLIHEYVIRIISWNHNFKSQNLNANDDEMKSTSPLFF